MICGLYWESRWFCIITALYIPITSACTTSRSLTLMFNIHIRVIRGSCKVFWITNILSKLLHIIKQETQVNKTALKYLPMASELILVKFNCNDSFLMSIDITVKFWINFMFSVYYSGLYGCLAIWRDMVSICWYHSWNICDNFNMESFTH
jgi:hypothetical protein